MMEDILQKLLAFPQQTPPPESLTDVQYDEAIRSHIGTVKNISESKLLQETDSKETLLSFLDPAVNTVAYAYALIAQIKSLQKSQNSSDTIWQDMCSFCGNFDARQIRYLGPELSQIIDAVSNFASRHNEIDLAIAPIRDALLGLDPSGAMLTSKHLILLKHVLASRQLSPALTLLDKPILYFPTSKSQKNKPLCNMSSPPSAYIFADSFSKKLKYQDVLEYFLGRGIVYIGLTEWRKALQSLEDCVSFPTKDGAVSKIQVDAYKKWLLVGLLLDGKAPSQPKTTSGQSLRCLSIVARPYESVAQIFESGTAARLKAEVDAGQTIWQEDRNTGLLLHVLSAYQKAQIRGLANVYTKMSITEVHNFTTSAETGSRLPNVHTTESLVRSMISDGSLLATLSSNGILSFSASTPQLSEKQFKSELANSTSQVKALTEQIKTTDHALTHDKDYVKWLQKQKKSGKGPAGSLVDAGVEMDWNGEDEDLMSGAF